MRFLIDSDVISNLMKDRPTQPAEAWFYALGGDEFAIPQIAVFEKYRGFEIRSESDPEDARNLEEWFDGFIASFEPEQIIAPDLETLRILAKMWSEPTLKNFIFNREGTKKAKTGGDLVIAATAIRHHMPIATFNVADFEIISESFTIPGIYHPGRDTWIKPYTPRGEPASTAAPLTAGTYAALSRRKAFRSDPAGARIGLLSEIARKAGITLTQEERTRLSSAQDPEGLEELGTAILNAVTPPEATRHLEAFLSSLASRPGHGPVPG